MSLTTENKWRDFFYIPASPVRLTNFRLIMFGF